MNTYQPVALLILFGISAFPTSLHSTNVFDRQYDRGHNVFDRPPPKSQPPRPERDSAANLDLPLAACQVAADVWASQEITAKHTNDIGPIENLHAQGINITLDDIRRSDEAFCTSIVEAQLQGFEIAAGRDNVQTLCDFIIETGRSAYMQMFLREGYHQDHAFHLSKFQTLLCLYRMNGARSAG